MGKLRSLLAGGVLGAIAGLLLAPQKGDKTRKKLKDEGEKLNEKAQELGKTVKEKSAEVMEKAKEIFGTNKKHDLSRARAGYRHDEHSRVYGQPGQEEGLLFSFNKEQPVLSRVRPYQPADVLPAGPEEC